MRDASPARVPPNGRSVSGTIEIWADGGCQGNPGPGAWAFVIRSTFAHVGRSGFSRATTNNRMELTAVIEALKELASHDDLHGRPVTVSTDSQYVQKGITEWILVWERNGWKTRAKKPVKNADLWETLSRASRALPIRWVWVMGHAGERMNEECHRMVEEAVAQGLKQDA